MYEILFVSLVYKEIAKICQMVKREVSNKMSMKNTSETNPLAKDLIVEAGREVTDISTYMKDKKRYDKEGKIPLTRLEKADKISVYTNPIVRNILNKLSGSATKIFVWIQQSILYGEDSIQLSSKRFVREMGMSPKTIVKAKKELIDNLIIAEMIDSSKVYWINPNILFKGSRIKKYPDKVIKYRNIGSGTTSDSKVK